MSTVADESTRPSPRLQRYATDRFLQINALIVVVLFVLGAADLVGMDSALGRAAHAVHELFGVMWWGILIAIFVIGILDKLPQELIESGRVSDAQLEAVVYANQLCNRQRLARDERHDAARRPLQPNLPINCVDDFDHGTLGALG